MGSLRYHAFALELSADRPLPGLHASAGPNGRPETKVRHVTLDELESRWDAASARELWSTRVDGESTGLARDAAGAHRLDFGAGAAFLIEPGVHTILYAAEHHSATTSMRFLLDTVLLVASLLAGFDALHASAVEREDGVLALVSETGGGKTSVAAELVRRGHPLFCDDILVLDRTHGASRTHPGPALMNVPSALDAASLGEPLATLGDETWVAVRPACSRPRPLAALVLLERRAGAPERLTRLEPQALRLLPHVIGATTWREHTARRFELVSDIADTTPLYRLEANLQTPPARIAVLAESVGRPVEAVTA